MGEEEANSSSIYVPPDLLKDIFLRLPLKSLVKFKTLSKEWRSILDSKSFSEMHLSFQKSEKSQRRKILAACHCHCGAPPSLHHPQGDQEFVYLHCKPTRPSMSCDGLVCIPEPGWVKVLNPSTGQLRRYASGPDPVPSPLNCRRHCFLTGAWSSFFPGYWAMGFGRDQVNGSYKVVRMFFDPHHYEILDVNNIGEWRKLSRPPPYEVEAGRRSACVNGSIYWLDFWRGIVKLLAFDLHAEDFHDVPLRPGMEFRMETQIVNLEDHLAIATASLNSDPEWELDIWTMDAQERWSKTYSISLASLCINPWEPRWFRPVIVSKEGNVVVIHDDKNRLFRYYQHTNTIRQIFPYTFVISPYLENMVRLQNDQVELRTDACTRGTTCIVKSRRLDKILCKGQDLGVLLWRSKMKMLATYLPVHLLCYRFCTCDTLSCAVKLIFVSWLVCLGVWGKIVKVMVVIILLKLAMASAFTLILIPVAVAAFTRACQYLIAPLLFHRS